MTGGDDLTDGALEAIRARTVPLRLGDSIARWGDRAHADRVALLAEVDRLRARIARSIEIINDDSDGDGYDALVDALDHVEQVLLGRDLADGGDHRG